MRIILFSIIFAVTVWPSSTVAQDISWISLEEAQQKASKTNSKVFIFAEAKWCGYCQKMNKNVFPNQSVQDSLKKYFLPVRLDIESDEKMIFNGEQYTQKRLAQKFRVTATPTMIFIDPDGEILGTQPGYLPPDVLDKLLTYVGREFYGKLQFKEYLNQQGISY